MQNGSISCPDCGKEIWLSNCVQCDTWQKEELDYWKKRADQAELDVRHWTKRARIAEHEVIQWKDRTHKAVLESNTACAELAEWYYWWWPSHKHRHKRWR